MQVNGSLTLSAHSHLAYSLLYVLYYNILIDHVVLLHLIIDLIHIIYFITIQVVSEQKCFNSFGEFISFLILDLISALERHFFKPFCGFQLCHLFKINLYELNINSMESLNTNTIMNYVNLLKLSTKTPCYFLNFTING